MKNWTTNKLGDIATLNYGKALVEDKRTKGDIPVYSSSGVSGWHNEPLIKSEAIIVGRKGNVGSVFFAKSPFYCIDTAYYILPSEKYDLKFLYYKLQSMNLIKLTSDSAVPGLNRQTAYAQEITIPNDIAEQKKIASILTSIDDKIELNLQMNQTLESMAQTIFKEWFVYFKFPGFDGECVNGLPKGWKMKNMLEICDVTDFVANGSFASLAEKVQYKSEPDHALLIRLTDYNRDFNGDFVYVNESAYNFLNKSKLFGGEIIIANVGANAGDVFRAPYLNVPMTLGPNAIMIKNNDYSNYLYLYLISPVGQHYIRGIISGSAQPKFNKTDFRKISLIVPEEKIINQFNELYTSLSNKLLYNRAQTRTLTQIRDSLLPKLMTGKIVIQP